MFYGFLVDIETQLLALKKSELLRGKLTPQEQKSLITGTFSLGECIKDAFFIQSAIPENPDLKKKVFKTVADLVITDDVIISSSTSCLMPDIIYADSSRKEQSIICHPVNPPYYAPMVEIIPHDETTQVHECLRRYYLFKIAKLGDGKIFFQKLVSLLFSEKKI